ncbi:LVIVD repeat-containing protein [Myxococcus landrumensis]|uniref:Lipoprotein n=1 Tax=Myxococcus landrumensis TaxID=2813577 RepID=A0ABX7N3N3_9BACT|nr:hypothetical protein [Myxococcus landrumus]QSQ13108.1 hypothetical protein JY572_32915 [Myxococcus landrumus]
MEVSARSLSTLLATLLLLLLTGCDDDPKPSSPDAGPAVWDGTYTELADPGDWIDPGAPYAPCTFNATDAGTRACEELARFDVSRCDREALAAVPQEGIYQGIVRNEIALRDGGVRIVSSDLSLNLQGEDAGTMFGEPLLQRDTQGGDFALVGQLPVTASTFAVVGCKRPAPHIITGCIATCRRGAFVRASTFEAHRVAKSGEPESSGGLTLLAEHRAALGQAVDVHVTRGHAYVVSLRHRDQPGGLTVFDVSNPRAPLLRTSISLAGNNDWNGVGSKDHALYIAGNGTGTLVYDISQPDNPVFIRLIPSGDYGTHTVFVDGNRLYTMGISTHVYDLTDPLNPALLTVISLPEDATGGGSHDAFLYEQRLYISNSFGGYAVVDVANLEDVRVLGRYLRPDQSFAHHSAVGTFGGKTIAFEGGEMSASHVRVLDVTDPAHIVKMGEFRMRQVTSMHNLLLRGHLLYVAWYQEGVRVLDVSNPTQPRQVAHYQTFREEDPGRGDSNLEGAFGLNIPGDGRVYVADSSRGLLIFEEL